MAAVVLVGLLFIIKSGFCEASDQVVLLGQGRVNEGAVLFRRSIGEEFLFLPAARWTLKNAQVACRELGFREAFVKTVSVYGHRFSVYGHRSTGGFTFDCHGNESSLDQCQRGSHVTSHSKLAGVLCHDEETRISQFPLLKLAVQPLEPLKVSLFPENPEWRILCTESNSTLQNIACQHAGYLTAEHALEILSSRGDLLLAHKEETCKELQLHSCNTRFHLVNNATCSEYGLTEFTCLYDEVSDNSILLREAANVSEGTVLFRKSKMEHFKFVQAAGWTLKNAQVVCRQFGYRHAAFAKTIESDRFLATAGFTFDCYGNESRLDQCKMDRHVGVYRTRLAGVFCYGVVDAFATDEVVIDVENEDDDAHAAPSTPRSSCCPPTAIHTENRKRKFPGNTSEPYPVSSTMRRSRPMKASPMSSSEYYKEMIRIETEKLNVMKETLEVKRRYMDQKIALLREKQSTSPKISQFSSLQPVAQPYEWRYPSRVIPASTFIPDHGLWSNDGSGGSGVPK